jgi:hypothetical protein
MIDFSCLERFFSRASLRLLHRRTSVETTTAPVDLSGVIDSAATYELRVYNSERDEWVDTAALAGSEISSIAVAIEMHGYRLIELKTR